MSKFQEIELLQAFYDRKLIPTLVHEIKPLPKVPEVAQHVLDHPALRALEGDWRTSDTSRRKFWLTVKNGTFRLHTAKIGHWVWARSNILDVGQDWIDFGADPSSKERLHYRLDDGTLTVTMPHTVFQGEFRLRQDYEE